MRRWTLAWVLMLAACAGDANVVDGGQLAEDGWPLRPADSQLTCPSGSDLIDSVASDGVRTVTCRSVGEPAPRGFKLIWNAGGTLIQRAELDDDGTPAKVTRFYVDGTRRSVEVFEGGKSALRESWYESGAKKSLRERTDDGVHIVKWQPDGTIQSEGQISGEKRVGTWKEWRDGALEVANYVEGVRQGRVERSYVDGSVESGEVVDGQRTGTWTRVNADGIRMLVIEYRYGKRHGRYTQFHPNRQPAVEGAYVDDQKHGLWISYYPQGKKRSEGEFRCGKEHGLWTWWHANGQIAERGEFKGGAKIGKWQKFSEAGRVTDTEVHRYGGPDPNCPL